MKLYIWTALGAFAGAVIAVWLLFPFDLTAATEAAFGLRVLAIALPIVGGVLGVLAASDQTDD